MNFDLVTRIESCFLYQQQSGQLNLILYAHIITAVIALVVGFFVFYKSHYSVASRIILSISIFFSLWSFLDLLTWFSLDSRIIMTAWSLMGIFYVLIAVFSFYFTYVFIEKKKASLLNKFIYLVIVLPVIIFTPTSFNLLNFNVQSCEAKEGVLFTNYYHWYGIMIFFCIFLYAIVKYYQAGVGEKRQIFLKALGIELFLLSFFSASYFASLLDNYLLLIYGLFGMPIFMGFLAYLIVKYKAFDIKLIGAQALVVALIILIGSQFAFIQTKTNMILNGVTFFLVSVFGWMLVRSVKIEVERKEQLQIMTDRLAMANDKLRKLDNAKSEFISIASHQLRTPLTAIKGYISLMLEGSYGDISQTLKSVINNIFLSNERLINLVEDLLNISRIESGRMEFNFAPCDVSELCREIYDTFVIRAKDRNLFLKIDLPKAPVSLTATTDRNKLREVVSNLVDNAVKYTPQGGVEMRAFQVDDKIRIEVKDTGIGIPDTEMPYLFAKFSRGKDTGRLNAGGTGLGLHVGKSMLEALHGKIWAESEGDGKGSTFIIELPLEFKE